MNVGDRIIVVGEFVPGSSLLLYGEGIRCGERGVVTGRVFADSWRILLDGDSHAVDFFESEIRELDAVERLAELA